MITESRAAYFVSALLRHGNRGNGRHDNDASPPAKKSLGVLQFSSAHFDNARPPVLTTTLDGPRGARCSRQRRARETTFATEGRRPRTRDGGPHFQASERATTVFLVATSERRKMAKREGSSSSRPRARKKAAREGREVREAESAQRLLDKLPPEVWGRILDELDENDLFPLALSCRYFRQKQKELVARTRQSGPESGLARFTLKTTLRTEEPEKGQPPSADYLRFCSKEHVGQAKHIGMRYLGSYTDRDKVTDRNRCIKCLAAFHGHLPLLQELLNPEYLDPEVSQAAGESPSSQSPLLLCFGF